jgi:3,4-dihydroxy 2-butanone 4-phosphate synthase / GTP cyclohydrolase II
VEANEKLGFAPDLRDYGVGCQILYDLGVRKLRLMTNNPKKYAALEGYGLTVAAQIPLVTGVGEENRRYMEAKRDRMGHLLPSTLGIETEAEPS